MGNAIAAIKKTTIKPGPAVLAILHAGALGSSWTEVVVQILEQDAFLRSDKDWTRWTALVKPFGVNLVAIEKGLATKAQASQTSAKAKKPAKVKAA